MNLLKNNFVGLISVLMLVGCSNAIDSDSQAEKLAKTTIEQASVVTNEIKQFAGLNDEQKSCVEKIDFSPIESKVKTILEKALTGEELKKINEFNASEPAQAFINYRREQTIIATGGTVDKPSPKPSEQQMKQVLEFRESDLGSKYAEVYESEEQGGLALAMENFLTQELTKCHVEMTK
ncbi:MAG: hypothetical protein CSA42_06865 [Gammaproteobacteria bacterium]|nr:MAG: hypothetical protein CSA42_06865 [Gammaproteobacteria bacterium]